MIAEIAPKRAIAALVAIFMFPAMFSLDAHAFKEDAVACYKTAIKEPLTFYGNRGDIFILYDGSKWKVVSGAQYEYIPFRYRDVIICPIIEKLMIGDKTLSVLQLDK